MTKPDPNKLSRRERQIMNILFRRGEGTVSDVLGVMEDPPSYSAVRATLGVLEEKGFLRHSKKGRQFVYRPTENPKKARDNALKHIVNTFFDGSAEGAVAALLEIESTQLTLDELERIKRMIEDAQEEGR